MKSKRQLITMMLALACWATAEAHRPWTFWYWMYGQVSKAGIKADLQAMKDAGLDGCYLMPIRDEHDAPQGLPPLKGPAATQLTPQFWNMVDYAMQQADSLGLQMGLHICDGFALAGGPWITPEESMQQVVWTDTLVTIETDGANLQSLLPQQAAGPEGYYRDIAAFAVRQPDDAFTAQPTVSYSLPDHDGQSLMFRTDHPGYMQFDYETPVTVRSIEVLPSGSNVQSERLLVQASTDGVVFRDVRQLAPPRQGWQNAHHTYTYALPETTARHYRFCWTPDGTEPGGEDLDAAKWKPVLKLQSLKLSAVPCIDQYEMKNGSVWGLAAPGAPGAGPVPEVIQISPRHPASVAPGTYRVLRFGHTATGQQNATGGGGKGLECDKFSVKAVDLQISRWFGEFMKRPNHQVVKYMHIDSWECGSQNWSLNFAEEFRRRRGYDLLPFMPVYAGVPMERADEVLRDIRQTIGDLISDVFFQTVKRRAEAYGVMLSAESVAPTMVADGMAHYRHADVPMGEFWLGSPTHDKPNDMLDAISAAHIYGKPIVQAEGFTEVRGVWDETPARLKPLIDRHLALGMNRLFFHVFTHNPWTSLKPGMTLDGIGLFFQRDQTWFPEARAMTDYVTRCQAWLQQGRHVADIAVYTGDEMPRRAVLPERLVNVLPGLIGPERVRAEQQRMANEGQPMEESPVGVNHAAAITGTSGWVNVLNGYQYDSMPPDALLSQPFGYKVLVVPPGTLLSDASRERITQLRKQGVTIIDSPYEQPLIQGLPQDAVLPRGIAFTHRTTDQADIYFLVNTNDDGSEMLIRPTLRASRPNVCLYRPLSDTYTKAEQVKTVSGQTTLSLTLHAGESVFVIISDQPVSPEPLQQPEVVISEEPINCRPPYGMPTWELTFANSGITMHSDKLFDWSNDTNDAIRYYSGHVRYATTFEHRDNKTRALLHLEGLHDVARVWLNGKDCGIVWAPPFDADISEALRTGFNRLEIEVVNTWHNALRGADLGRPPFDGIWTNAKYRTKGGQLLPAGLLGPVTIKMKR